MSTRCEIGVIGACGKIKAVYNHCDGYLEGVGKDLVTDWNTPARAAEVVNGLYNLEESTEYDNVYQWCAHLEGTDREFVYLYKDGKWLYRSVGLGGHFLNNTDPDNWLSVEDDLKALKEDSCEDVSCEDCKKDCILKM